MNPTLIVPLTIREAKEAKITLPVTRPYPLCPATHQTVYKPVIQDLSRSGIPYAIVIESDANGRTLAAVWRGNPPKPKRTAHQFRAELHRDVYAS
jgi:hypothetical protein